jgi:hypothetical protein
MHFLRGLLIAVVVVLLIVAAGFLAIRFAWGRLPNFFEDVLKFFIGYSRGAGHIPDCGPKEYDAGLCYPYCRAGYQGVGPVCWQACPGNFTDTGLDCLKPAAYGRGFGYVTQSLCESKENAPCETWGDWGLWYPYCRPNYYNFGCCICSPQCPDDMLDIGISCQKGSYQRGLGTIPASCPAGQENNAGLCYAVCDKGYDGVAAFCWRDWIRNIIPSILGGGGLLAPRGAARYARPGLAGTVQRPLP